MISVKGTLSFVIVLVVVVSGIFIDIGAQTVKNYERFTGIGCIVGIDSVVILRQFSIKKQKSYFFVDPKTLKTGTVAADSCWVDTMSLDTIFRVLSSSVYCKSLKEALRNSDTVRSAGITHFTHVKNGIDLTIDLCPSKHPLDRGFITDLVKELGVVQKPVPLAFSITGNWMFKHQDDLAWLKDLVKNQEISVTWINHSYNHREIRDTPAVRNFLLEKSTDLQYEILNTERKMIENGIMPSIFFRFPGLISNDSLFIRVTFYGVIPVGSDAWLAKGTTPKEGSIILVHANGNEPLGLERFIALLKDEKASILNNNWMLYDLRESVVEEESGE